MHAGYREEAQAWGAWLRRSVAGTPAQVQTLYGLGGERWIMEWEVPWLAGYQGAKPVRVGNAASTQLQLDVYGELIDALYQEVHGGLVPPGESWDCCRPGRPPGEIWEQPDESIWEVRGGAQHFTFSKAMVWVAMDRAIRAAEEFALPGPLDAGGRCARGSTTPSAGKGSTPAKGVSCSTSAPTTWMRACCCCRWSGFCPPRIRGCAARSRRSAAS